MIRQFARYSLLILCAAATCGAQVVLTTASPAGVAGISVEKVTGAGFPAGTISPTNVTVSFAPSCNGTALVQATPTSVTPGAAAKPGSRGVIFQLPATLKAGTYAVSVQDALDQASAFSTATCASITVSRPKGFVEAVDGHLRLNGKPFRFAGGNEVGLTSSTPAQTDQQLQVAAKYELQTLRVWSFIDIGNQDGTNSVDGIVNGYYLQYWNGSAPAYNDGPTGLQNLDYAVYQAAQQGFKLIMTLTNNWTPAGGMDQYVAWAGDQYHDQFYTDPKIRGWYEAWISHLLNHVNIYTGKAYKDDPAIFLWELANEPECRGSGDYPTSPSCTTKTLSDWVTAESAYIKSFDPNHLVAVGDEGYFCANPNDPNSGCGLGVDSLAFSSAPAVDLVGLHNYTSSTTQDPIYGQHFIEQHIAMGKSLGKPTYVGEYGLQSGNQRNAIYVSWLETVLHDCDAAGALFWGVSGGEPGPIAAESGQSLGLADQAPLFQTIRNAAQEFAWGGDMNFNPAADDQWATTTLNTPVPLNPFQNVLAYGGSSVKPSSINLNPGGAPQTSVHVYGGQFAASGGKVLFTPDNNFNGQSVAPFTVRDSAGRLSNTAYLYATVNPTENVAWEIESFETGADGWASLGAADPAVMSTTDATDGPHSLQVTATQSGWFGVQFPSPLNLTGRPELSLDIVNAGTPASADLVIQAGNNWEWCQSNSWPWLTTNTETTLTMPLTAAGTGCADVDLTQVRSIFVYLTGGNTYYIDNLRAAAVPANQLPIDIASFETGTDGWTGQNGAGTVAQENVFYTDGAYGLQVDSSGGWFGTNGLGTLDLSSKSGIAYDIDTPGNGSSVNMQLVWGPSNTVCTGTNWGWADSSLSTQTIPFSSLDCTPDLTQVHGVWLFMSGGTFYIDNVRAE